VAAPGPILATAQRRLRTQIRLGPFRSRYGSPATVAHSCRSAVDKSWSWMGMRVIIQLYVDRPRPVPARRLTLTIRASPSAFLSLATATAARRNRRNGYVPTPRDGRPRNGPATATSTYHHFSDSLRAPPHLGFIGPNGSDRNLADPPLKLRRSPGSTGSISTLGTFVHRAPETWPQMGRSQTAPVAALRECRHTSWCQARTSRPSSG
jgi:hypothetical protein